jgi:seryl-tRNA synthetase
MHDIKLIRENPEEFDRKLATRFIKPISSHIMELDKEQRRQTTILQQLQQARNEKAKLIGEIKDKTSEEFEVAKKDAQDIKNRISELEKKIADEDEITNFLAAIPNLPADDVPVGKDEESNVEIRKWGTVPNFSFKPKEHWEIGETLGQMDFEHTATMSGARFVTLKAGLARLERALANFMLDIHTNEFGYTEIVPPLLVRDSAMYGVGQLPKFAEDSFQTTNGYRLIPTSEVSLTNLVSDQILDEQALPFRFTAYTPCFRSEAGSAGRDTRGMFRQHQFTKVELVSIVKPENSIAEHERMTSAAETILQRLKLPYRVMLLCSGDMGFSARKTYDLEVWLPGQDKYREISSCSNCGDFQARRMKARYRGKGEKETKFVHTLNGSGLAIGRTMIAIIENYQNEDGSVNIPDDLVPYMGGMKVIK